MKHPGFEDTIPAREHWPTTRPQPLCNTAARDQFDAWQDRREREADDLEHYGQGFAAGANHGWRSGYLTCLSHAVAVIVVLGVVGWLLWRAA